MIFKRRQRPSTDGRNYLPVMSQDDLRSAVRDAGTGYATALLVYTESVYEVVTGNFKTVMEDENKVSYWVGDRLVAVMDLGEEPQVVPALVSLRINFVFPLINLTTERQEAV